MLNNVIYHIGLIFVSCFVNKQLFFHSIFPVCANFILRAALLCVPAGLAALSRSALLRFALLCFAMAAPSFRVDISDAKQKKMAR
jgi:hypothetical protein